MLFVTLKAVRKWEYFGHKMYNSDYMKKDLILVLTDGSGKYGRQCTR